MNYHYERDTSTAAEHYHRARGFASSSNYNTASSRVSFPSPIDLDTFELGKAREGIHQSTNSKRHEFGLIKNMSARKQSGTSSGKESSVFERVFNLPEVVTGLHVPPDEKGAFFLGKSLVNYFQRISESPEFRDTATIRNAKVLLYILGAILGVKELPTPQVAPSEENSLAFSWQKDNHQLGIYVYPNGKFDWLWRDPISKDYEGEEDVNLDIYVPSKLVNHLRNIFADR